MEEPGRLQSTGSQRGGQTELDQSLKVFQLSLGRKHYISLLSILYGLKVLHLKCTFIMNKHYVLGLPRRC